MKETRGRGRPALYDEAMIRISQRLPHKLWSRLLRICVRKGVKHPTALTRQAIEEFVEREEAAVGKHKVSTDAGLPFGSASD